MPRRPRFLPAVVGSVLLVGMGTAWVAAAQSRTERQVAKVGEHVITVGDVEEVVRLAPVFHLRGLGKTNDEVRHTLVDTLVTLELMAVAARDEKLDQRPDIAEDIRLQLKEALEADLRREVEGASPVADEEIAAYYQAHRAEYASELRLKLWRIVVATQQEAQQIIDLTKTDPEFKKDALTAWEKLARDRSLDTGTSKRGGSLGLVRSDGTTAHKDVSVNPVLFEKAQAVGNGQVVPEPIQDGRFWVVVYRGGSVQTPERTLAMEANQIRRMLERRRGQRIAGELLERLRKKYVSQTNFRPIEQLEVTAQGEVQKQQRPGTLPRIKRPPAGPPRPEGPPGDMR